MDATRRILYRGTNGSDARIRGGISEGALFVTPHRDVAELYGDRIATFSLHDSASVLVEGSAEFAQVTGRRRGEILRSLRKGETLRSACDDAAARAEAAGYDAIEFTSLKDLGIAVFNRDAIVEVPRVDTRLTGRRTVLYHGSANFDAIVAEGLIFNRDRTNDFGTGDNLASCGGTYLADSLFVASRYAENALGSEAGMGGDPCAFAVEVDEGLLVADEDKVWDVIEEAIRAVARLTIDETDGPEESREWAEGLFARHGAALASRLRMDLDLDPDISDDVIEAGVRGFLLRSQCWSDWLSLGEESDDAVAAIDALCIASRGPVSHSWLSQRYDFYSLTARVLDTVPADGAAQAPARIVGHVRLQMSNDGLEVLGIETAGAVSEDDARIFLDGFVEAAASKGVEIEVPTDLVAAL